MGPMGPRGLGPIKQKVVDHHHPDHDHHHHGHDHDHDDPGSGAQAGTRNLLCIHKRISCVYTRDLLCMHNTLVHALGQGTQGPGPKKGAWAGPRPGPRPFWALAPGFPGPEPAQECCACARHLLCIHKRFFLCTQEIFCVYTSRYVKRTWKYVKVRKTKSPYT